jgi:transposase
MFTVELYARIRRAVMVDGLSRREAAKRFGVHRNTIAKMLQFSIPPGYRRRERPASKKLGPYMAWIDAILEGDRSVHKKQRHTAHRIFERLRNEQGGQLGQHRAMGALPGGYSGGSATVTRRKSPSRCPNISQRRNTKTAPFRA